MKLSIVIPSFNEALNLPLIAQRFKEVIKRDDIEVIIVNNGSTDNTKEILEEICAQNSFVKVVTVEVNQGYGYGIIQGLKTAQGEYIGWTHGDMQTDPPIL